MTATLLELRDRDPYAYYEELRAQSPVVWDEGMQAWLVLGHAECVVVERREDLFAPGMGSLPGAKEITGARSILTMRGEPHDALHKQLSKWLTPARCQYFADTLIRPVATRVVEHVAPRGHCELHHDVAELIPLGVVGELLGMPPWDEPKLRHLKQRFDQILAWRHTYGTDDEILEIARQASFELDDEFGPTVRERREHPTDDLISELWRAGEEGVPDWTERDVLDQCKVLFEAGVETTALTLSSVAWVLATNEEARALVEHDRGEPLARVIEETLRYQAPVQMRVRQALEDVELGGERIRKGDRVHPINAAANRDPSRYPEPDSFRLDRKGWASHLTFNVGPRQCVGAALARLEITETMNVMLDCWPGFRLDPQKPSPAFAGFVSRSYVPLYLVWSQKSSKEPA
jgi:cytochrome P450